MKKRSSLGSIQKLPDKRFKVTVTVGYKYVGNKKKQIRKSKTVNSMKEAREFLRQYDNEQEQSDITLEEYAKIFLENYSDRPSTLVTARYFIHQLDPLFHRKLSSIRGDELDELIESFRYGYAPSTLAGLTTYARMLFNKAVRDHYLEKKPEIKKHGSMHKTNTLKILPPINEIRELLEKARQGYQAKKGYHYLYHFLLLMVSTGMRVGEICALKWEALDYYNNTISIHSTIAKSKNGWIDEHTTKTESSTRIIPVEPELLETLNEIPRKGEYIFYTRQSEFVTPSHISTSARKFFDMHGYPKLRLYDLRHIHATELIAHGIDIKTVSHRLGHKSPMVTLNSYTHYNSANDKEASRLMSSLVLKKCLTTIEEPNNHNEP